MRSSAPSPFPGLGTTLVNGIAERDWMIIQNVVLLYGISFVINQSGALIYFTACWTREFAISSAAVSLLRFCNNEGNR